LHQDALRRLGKGELWVWRRHDIIPFLPEPSGEGGIADRFASAPAEATSSRQEIHNSRFHEKPGFCQANHPSAPPRRQSKKRPSAEAGCGTKIFAGFAFHFEVPEKTRSPSLKVSRTPPPEKNSENFRILQRHNRLSARRLQKTVETSIYKNAEIGKAEMSLRHFFLAKISRASQNGRVL
jgi:hypothetical protein